MWEGALGVPEDCCIWHASGGMYVKRGDGQKKAQADNGHDVQCCSEDTVVGVDSGMKCLYPPTASP
jgi:hypothetical protein